MLCCFGIPFIEHLDVFKQGRSPASLNHRAFDVAGDGACGQMQLGTCVGEHGGQDPVWVGKDAGIRGHPFVAEVVGFAVQFQNEATSHRIADCRSAR